MGTGKEMGLEWDWNGTEAETRQLVVMLHPHCKPRHIQTELKVAVTLPLKRQNCTLVAYLCVFVA